MHLQSIFKMLSSAIFFIVQALGRCGNNYDPVCDHLGNTHANFCKMRVAGRQLGCHGRCPCLKDMFCTSDLDPVCSQRGYTYTNMCALERAHQDFACYSKCPCRRGRWALDSVDVCSIYMPVCATDYLTYPNPCEVPDGEATMCSGPCPCENCDGNSPICGSDGATYRDHCDLKRSASRLTHISCHKQCPCECPTTLNTVCGSNGLTYDNECTMALSTANEVSKACDGVCPCSSVSSQTS